MKSLVRKVANSALGIKLRNNSGFRPVPIIIDKNCEQKKTPADSRQRGSNLK